MMLPDPKLPSRKSTLSPVAQSVLAKDATIAYLLREAHRALARDLQDRLQPYGINVGAWRFLRVLWEEDGISQRELGLRVGMTAPTTVLALDRIEKRGLVVRVRNPGDRRLMSVRLTKKGKALRDELLPHAAEANAIACTGFSAQDVITLRRLLVAVRSNIEKHGKGVDKGDAY
jgi:DNA-binding MarR family transcriptional regulator